MIYKQLLTDTCYHRSNLRSTSQSSHHKGFKTLLYVKIKLRKGISVITLCAIATYLWTWGSTIIDIIVWQKVKNPERTPFPLNQCWYTIVLFLSAYSHLFLFQHWLRRVGRHFRSILNYCHILCPCYYVGLQ